MSKKTSHNSYFITSAAQFSQCPEHSFKEIAVIGRSNVGKSSLLNKILKQNLVKVSQTPGKTQLINFFSKENKYCLVDLPGYGYAQLSKDVVQTWKEMIETYLLQRDQLKGILLLVDIRRGLQDEEKLLIKNLKNWNLPMVYVFTKTDKLTPTEFKKTSAQLKKLNPLFFTSSLKSTGIEDLEDYIYKKWIKE